MFKILFPTDFSQNARNTIDHFCGWFDPTKVEIVIFHAIIPPKSVGGAFVSIEREMAKIAQEEMNKEIDRLKSKFSHQIEGLCRAGFLQDCLDIAIRKMDADITIMCSKGESDVESKIFGSNAEHCLRRASYPIFVSPTALPDRMEHLIYATEDGYLQGRTFLTAFFEVLGAENLTLDKLRIVSNSADLEKTYRAEEFLGKELKLHLHEDKSAIDGIEYWLELNQQMDAIILNSHHKKWYDYLLNNSTTKKLAAAIKLPILSLPNLK
ncbi:universal stress protein [Bacteroidia bacterium]|nr:universal stress protein [Bacteroidia bacterium]